MAMKPLTPHSQGVGSRWVEWVVFVASISPLCRYWV